MDGTVPETNLTVTRRIPRRWGAVPTAASALLLFGCLLQRSPVVASGQLTPGAPAPGGAALTGTTASPSALPDPLGLLAPPPPDAPAGPAGACRFPRLGAGEVRRVYSLPVPSAPGGGVVSPHGAIDPRQPCVTLRTLDDRIDRGVNGTGFTTVFRRAAAPAWRPGAPMTLAAPVFAGTTMYVYDTTGNGGIFASADDGGHWTERDSGLPLSPAVPDAASSSGLSSPTTVTALVFGRSQLSTGYALVTVAGGTTLLFRTGDGGTSWQLRPTPDPSQGEVAVDPFDADHVVTARDDGTNDLQPWSYYESADGGQTWTPRPGPEQGAGTLGIALRGDASRDGQSVVDLLVRLNDTSELWSQPAGTAVISPARWVRRLSGDISAMESSAGDPARLTLVASVTVVGANPAAGNRLLAVLSSTTDFTTYAERVLPPLMSDARVRNLETDASGDIAVDVTTADPRSAWGEVEAEDLFIVPPTALTGNGPTVVTSLPVTTTPSPLGPGSAPPSNEYDAPMAVPVRTCPLDDGMDNGGTHSGQFPYDYASITFDGRYLDFTDDPANVIFRVDPRTCRRVPAITVSASDTGGVAQQFNALTYDPDYVFDDGASGAILVGTNVSSDPDPRLPDGRYVPIYAVSPLPPYRVELATAVITSTGGSNPNRYRRPFRDPTAFTYDVSRHALWVGSNELYLLPHHKGAPASDRLDSCTQTGTAGSGWVAGAGRVMYVEGEDDKSVYRFDTTTCMIISGFRHAPVAESAVEIDQMACDNATFAEQRPGGSVLWIRDAAGTVTAYAIPVGDCPYVRPALPPVLPLHHPMLTAGGLFPPSEPPLEPIYVPQPLPATTVAPAQTVADAQVQAQAQIQVQSTTQAQVGVLPQRQRQAQAARQGVRQPQSAPVMLGQPQPLLAVRTVALRHTAGAGAVLMGAAVMGMMARRRAVVPAAERCDPRG